MKGSIGEWLSRQCIVAAGNEFHQDIIIEKQGLSAPVLF